MAHNKYLRQAVRAIVHARLVRNGLWRGSFLFKKPHVRGGFSGGLFASNVTQMVVFSGCYGYYGSMGPRGHVRRPEWVIGAVPGPRGVQKDRLRGSFLV